MKTTTKKHVAKTTSTKQQEKLPRFRLCMRGTDAKGKYKRRMKYVPAHNYEEAAALFTKFGPEMAKGLKNCYTQIMAPLY